MTNPFLSLWLSALNSAAGATRGFAMAEFQRQQTAMWREMTKQTLDFWSGAWFGRISAPPANRGATKR